MEKNTSPSKNRVSKTYSFPAKVPVLITKEVLAKIKYLCNEISTVEWSGVIFYTVDGGFSTGDAKVKIVDLFPMDKGTAGYTEYDTNEELIAYMTSNPETLVARRGHCHSHASGIVFFSGTDISELEDNSEFHNYYLSIIVNNRIDIIGKVAFRATVEKEQFVIKYRNDDGDYITKPIDRMKGDIVMFTYDCDITLENEIILPKTFLNRVKEVINKTAKRIVPDYHGYQSGQPYTPTTDNLPDNLEDAAFELLFNCLNDKDNLHMSKWTLKVTITKFWTLVWPKKIFSENLEREVPEFASLYEVAPVTLLYKCKKVLNDATDTTNKTKTQDLIDEINLVITEWATKSVKLMEDDDDFNTNLYGYND